MSGVESFSENEDDPYESSGSEWSDSEVKKRGRQRTSARNTKKARISVDSSSEDSSEVEEVKPRTKNGVNKKQKVRGRSSSSSPPALKNGSKINSKDFSVGSFLILKKDAQVGDPKKKPCLWRVDGKALLQKYEAFEDENKIRHKTTSIYTGWSALDKDNYAPVTVTVSLHSNQDMVVDLDWENLKEITMDSD